MQFVYADIIYNIATFADLASIYNISRTNWQFYRVITGDPRFMFLKIVSLVSKRIYFHPRFLINLAQCDRYLYYKIIQAGQFWNFVAINSMPIYTQFYKDLAMDTIIVDPPRFNPLYNKYYYAYKYLTENYGNHEKYYEFNFNRIIKYIKHPGSTAFPNFIKKFSAYVLRLEDTEFAKNCNFLHGLRKGFMMVPLRFNYLTYTCGIDVNVDKIINYMCVQHGRKKYIFGYNSKFESNWYEKFIKFLQTYLQLDDEIAKIFTKFLILYFKTPYTILRKC